MKTPVIDSIRMASNDGIYPELEKIARRNRDECGAALEPLEKTLDSLPLDEAAVVEIMDLGADLFSEGAEAGFRRGFRVEARLMLESLEAPEAPERGGGA